MYFAKLINAAFLPSQNHKFVDTETQCYFILRFSTGYVLRGVIACSFYNHGGRFIQDQQRIQKINHLYLGSDMTVPVPVCLPEGKKAVNTTYIERLQVVYQQAYKLYVNKRKLLEYNTFYFVTIVVKALIRLWIFRYQSRSFI